MIALIPYYNFANAPRLLDNHITATRMITDTGTRCITIMLTLEGEADQGMQSWDGHTVLTRITRSILWHKEALINIGYAWARDNGHLDDGKVMWIDSGCYLGPDDAYAKVAATLDDKQIIQAFHRIHYHEQDGSVKTVARGMIQSKYHPPFIRRAPGGAWAAVSGFFEAGGLYPYAIMGGGDSVLTAAVAGINWIQPLSSYARTALMSYVRKMRRFQAHLGYASDVTFHHLWHMPPILAQIRARHGILVKHRFSPARDIVLENGILEWSPHALKTKPRLIKDVADYIKQRSS